MAPALSNNIYSLLEERGFVYQSTDPETLGSRLEQGSTVFYVGFDPTGSSLHVGHLLPIMGMRWMARAGHRPIALVGGGTGMVGDPSGKSEARPVLTPETIAANTKAIRRQIGQFLDFDSANGAVMVDNSAWLSPLKYIDFLRDYGRHFSVNRMLAAESVKQRLETGLSFLEFNYMLLQAYDFMVLNRDYDCELQMGGRDQWGNIVAGIDLVRRINRREVYGLTFPLLLKGDGEKFGKTAGGAVWLDPERTSPYEYYQFWRNSEDAEVGRLLAFFTELPMAEVRRLGRLRPPAINRAKEILGFEATRLAHGEAAARQAWLAAGREFGFADPENRIQTSSPLGKMPAAQGAADLPAHDLGRGDSPISILDLLSESGLCQSKSEARRLIRGGGCYLDDDRVEDENQTLPPTDLAGKVLRAGKKKRVRLV